MKVLFEILITLFSIAAMILQALAWACVLGLVGMVALGVYLLIH